MLTLRALPVVVRGRVRVLAAAPVRRRFLVSSSSLLVAASSSSSSLLLLPSSPGSARACFGSGAAGCVQGQCTLPGGWRCVRACVPRTRTELLLIILVALRPGAVGARTGVSCVELACSMAVQLWQWQWVEPAGAGGARLAVRAGACGHAGGPVGLPYLDASPASYSSSSDMMQAQGTLSRTALAAQYPVGAATLLLAARCCCCCCVRGGSGILKGGRSQLQVQVRTKSTWPPAQRAPGALLLLLLLPLTRDQHLLGSKHKLLHSHCRPAQLHYAAPARLAMAHSRVRTSFTLMARLIFTMQPSPCAHAGGRKQAR